MRHRIYHWLPVWLISVGTLSGQTADSLRRLDVRGTVAVTNNGFSFIPSFSLGEPAVLTTFAIHGGKRFRFEPEFRYSLAGKPWSFIFIWRYQLVRRERFLLTVGTHLPALSFRTRNIGGGRADVIESLRFFPVAEVSPVLTLGKHTKVGLFYLYGHGLEADMTKRTRFVSFRAGFEALPLGGNWRLNVQPQAFHLQSDAVGGYYVAAGLSVYRVGRPWAVSSLMNRAVRSEIAGKRFDWNISLSYTFHRTYTGRADHLP